jgi:DNA-binding GntR family transcriptional regulator
VPRLELDPVRSQGLTHEVHDRLVEAIRAGRLKPGEQLVETDLAVSLQVSGSVVREALRLLGIGGLVISTPKPTPRAIWRNTPGRRCWSCSSSRSIR